MGNFQCGKNCDDIRSFCKPTGNDAMQDGGPNLVMAQCRRSFKETSRMSNSRKQLRTEFQFDSATRCSENDTTNVTPSSNKAPPLTITKSQNGCFILKIKGLKVPFD